MRFISLFIALIFSLNAIGATIGDNTLLFGSGANVTKKIFFRNTTSTTADDPYLSWDVSTGSLSFSNDGSVVKKLGSGSGGGDAGVNLLSNSSFEDGLTGYTNSGGTFSQQTYANGTEGDTKYARFVATTSGQYVETSTYAVPTFGIGGCLAKINYQTTDLTSWKLQIYDNSANLLSEQNLSPKEWQNGYVPIKCPVVSTLIKMRLTSLAAGTINWDKNYLGSENRTYQVASKQYLGGLTFETGTTCGWGVAGAPASWSSHAVDADCTDPTVRGIIKKAATKLPAFVIPAGTPSQELIVNVNGFFQQEAANQSCTWRLYDGAVASASWSAYDNSAAAIDSGATVRYAYTTSASDVTVQIQVYGSGGACTIYGNNAGQNKLNFDVYSVEQTTNTALSVSAQDWYIAGNIGGADPNLGTSTLSTYTEITNSSLDYVPMAGSAAANIACASGTASVGLNCNTPAVAESLGLSFNIPESGKYKACFAFGNYINSSGAASTTFQVVETTDSSSAVVSEGGERMMNYVTTGLNAGSNTMKVCGIFNFTSVGLKTVRLEREQTTGHSVNTIHASRSAGGGQEDIFVEVYPLFVPVNRPYLSGEQVTAPGATNTYLFGGNSLASGGECTASPCTTGNPKGPSIMPSTYVRSSTGLYVITWAKVLSSRPACSVSPVGAANSTYDCKLQGMATTTGVSIRCANASNTVVDEGWSLTCIGD